MATPPRRPAPDKVGRTAIGHIRETLHVDALLNVCCDIGTHADRVPEWSEGVLEVDCELPGSVIGDLVSKLLVEPTLERQMRHSNKYLKAICEAQAPARV